MKKEFPRRSRAVNKKASFEVAVEETFEAGLVLTGDEIKSIRANRVQLTGSYIKFLQNSPYVVGLHLALAQAPDRSRKLLLHEKEITTVRELLQAKGKTAVPLNIYIHRGWAKLTFGVGSGRKTYQKRELLKRRDEDRRKEIELKALPKA